jgi:hypothetical protein
LNPPSLALLSFRDPSTTPGRVPQELEPVVQDELLIGWWVR